MKIAKFELIDNSIKTAQAMCNEDILLDTDLKVLDQEQIESFHRFNTFINYALHHLEIIYGVDPEPEDDEED